MAATLHRWVGRAAGGSVRAAVLTGLALLLANSTATAAPAAIPGRAEAGTDQNTAGAAELRGAPIRRLGSETVAHIARTWLAERLAPATDRSKIELTGVPRDLVLPPGDVTTSVRLQAGSLAGGPVTLLVEAIVTEPSGARTARSTTVGFRVNGEQDVLVALRELPRRSVIAASDVRVERRPIERIPPAALGERRDVIGKEVARPIAPGEVVTASAVTPVIAIRRGSAVTLLLEGPGFRIVARGIASEDGAPGQTIRVVNQSSRREMVGKVEDERTVRIPF